MSPSFDARLNPAREHVHITDVPSIKYLGNVGHLIDPSIEFFNHGVLGSQIERQLLGFHGNLVENNSDLRKDLPSDKYKQLNPKTLLTDAGGHTVYIEGTSILEIRGGNESAFYTIPKGNLISYGILGNYGGIQITPVDSLWDAKGGILLSSSPMPTINWNTQLFDHTRPRDEVVPYPFPASALAKECNILELAYTSQSSKNDTQVRLYIDKSTPLYRGSHGGVGISFVMADAFSTRTLERFTDSAKRPIMSFVDRVFDQKAKEHIGIEGNARVALLRGVGHPDLYVAIGSEPRPTIILLDTSENSGVLPNLGLEHAGVGNFQVRATTGLNKREYLTSINTFNTPGELIETFQMIDNCLANHQLGDSSLPSV